MLNKLKSSLSSNLSSTITNTVYSTGNIISGVLPGNPVTREYEVSSRDHVTLCLSCLMSGDCTRGQRRPGAHVEGVQWIQEDNEAVSQHLRAGESRSRKIRQTGQGGGVGPHEEGG